MSLFGKSRDDMLLNSPLSLELYEKYAKDLPVFDYHSHVSAEEIYRDRHYSNIAELWLECDHYKWRLMRQCGIDEHYITGNAEPREKFLMLARVLPRCVGNPVHTWCHMELKKYFGYDGVLCAETAERVWDITCRMLSDKGMGVRDIIEKSGVTLIGTTNDPCDSLEYHKLLGGEGLSFSVLPTFRPDAYLNIESEGFCESIERLAFSSGLAIDGIKTLKSALRKRMNYFAACGCVSADHGYGRISFAEHTEDELDRIFKKAMSGASISDLEADKFSCGMLLYCARQYADLGWVLQIHYGCQRNVNNSLYSRCGADCGADCIRRQECSQGLCALLDRMHADISPKIILYALDPSENAFIDTVVGSFAEGEPMGRIAHGAAWWFNDTCYGIREHIECMSSIGVLGSFVGMVTDSRSFLSYVRHDLFRRLLCSHIALVVQRGEYFCDERLTGELIRDICFGNAVRFFGMEAKT